MSKVIEINHLKKDYVMGEITVRALKGVSLEIEKGEFVAIMGASGSGKSTMMNIIGCLDISTDGEYKLDGVDIGSLTKDEYADIRNQKIGFIFQGFNLLSRTTALENVELPLLYDRTNKKIDSKSRAEKCLEMVGLAERIDHVPNQLSGGQQQRVAIARALVNEPALILADEPTGNLDSKTSLEIMALFQELNAKGITIIIVTHEPEIAEYTKRTVILKDGHKIHDHYNNDIRNAREDLSNWKEVDDLDGVEL
jgi:putative ABC transport system ATP-binding protein